MVALIKNLGRSIPRDLEKCAFGLFLAGVFSITFSIALGQTMLIACFILLAISLVRSHKRPVFPHIAWFALLFTVIAIFAYVHGIAPEKSIKGVKRLFWFILLIPVSATLVNTRARLTSFLKAYVFGSVALSLYILVGNPIKAFCAWNTGEMPDFLTALIDAGSMTKGQMLLLGILACLAFVFIAHTKKKQRILWWVLLGVQCIAMVVNFKRGSWMCLGALGMLFVMLRTGWKGMVSVLVIMVITLLLPPVQERLRPLKGELNMWSGGRMTMWTKVMPGIVRAHPWGIGYKSMTNELMQESAKDAWLKDNPGQRLPDRNLVEWERKHLHSNIFQVLIETGWLGLAVYIAWMICATINGVVLSFKSRDNKVLFLETLALLFMLLGLFANGLVEYNFGDTELIIVISVIMGAIGRQRMLEKAG